MWESLHPWRAEEPLTDLTLHADWDSIASMILSLRIHGFEHGTIPIWNFMLCGGSPELSVPHSWAYTWPSVFAYALSPNHAILALWAVMTGIGLLATRALLLRWFGNALGAWVGACVYASSGYFGARFNAGHVTFAFFHLVPVLMLLFEAAFARAQAGRPNAGVCTLTLLVSFLFASAALPHALIHFYPAFLLLVLVRVASAVWLGGWGSLRAAAAPVAANLLGLWLAAYKLWPVIRWQLDSPRADVRLESYRLTQLIGNTLSFVPDYFQRGKQQAWHVFSSWEYNAFVGPLPWLLALIALVGLLRRGDERGVRLATGFALLLVAAGIALSLGNDNRLSPAYLFAGLPPLDGVRAFSRYQILIVFGLAVLAARGFARIAEGVTPPKRLPLLAALAVGLIGPVLAQSACLFWNISAERNADILAEYGGPGGEPPRLVRPHVRRLHRSRHQTSLLAGGYWIANCSSDLTLPGKRPTRRLGFQLLSVPPPQAVERIGRNDIVLRYAEGEQRRVRMNLRHHEGSRLDVPSRLDGPRLSFDASSLPGGRVTLTTDYAGPARGAAMSAAGAVASGAFLIALRRRERSR